MSSEMYYGQKEVDRFLRSGEFNYWLPFCPGLRLGTHFDSAGKRQDIKPLKPWMSMSHWVGEAPA